MKLHELKEATVKLKLPDTKHVAEMGKIAFRMGVPLTSNPHRTSRYTTPGRLGGKMKAAPGKHSSREMGLTHEIKSGGVYDGSPLLP